MIRAMRVLTGATRVELPTFRDAAGQSRAAIVLPDEVHGPIGDAVIESLIERGLAKRRFTMPTPDGSRRPPPFRTYILHGKRGRISEAWFFERICLINAQ